MEDLEAVVVKEAQSPRSTEVVDAGDILSHDEAEGRSLAVGVEFHRPQSLDGGEASVSDAGYGQPLSTEGEEVISTIVGLDSLSRPRSLDGSAVRVSGHAGAGKESHSPSLQDGELAPIYEAVQDEEGWGVPFPAEDDEVLGSAPVIDANEGHVTVLLKDKEPSFRESCASPLQERTETSALEIPKAGSETPLTSAAEAEKASVFEVIVARAEPHPPHLLACNVVGCEMYDVQVPEKEVQLSEVVVAGPVSFRLEGMESAVSGSARLDAGLCPSNALESREAPLAGLADSPLNNDVDTACAGAHGSYGVHDIEMIGNKFDGNQVESFRVEAEITETGCIAGVGDAAMNREVEPLSVGTSGRDEVAADENEMSGNKIAGVGVEISVVKAEKASVFEDIVAQAESEHRPSLAGNVAGCEIYEVQVPEKEVQLSEAMVAGPESFSLEGMESVVNGSARLEGGLFPSIALEGREAPVLGVADMPVNKDADAAFAGAHGSYGVFVDDIEMIGNEFDGGEFETFRIKAEITETSCIAGVGDTALNRKVEPSPVGINVRDEVAADENGIGRNKVAGVEVEILGVEAEISADTCIAQVSDGAANEEVDPSFGDTDGDGVAEIETEMPVNKVAGDEVDISEVEAKIIGNNIVAEVGGVVNDQVNPSFSELGIAGKDDLTKGDIEMAGNNVAGDEVDISEAGKQIGRTCVIVGIGDGAVNEEVVAASSDADGRRGIAEDEMDVDGGGGAVYKEVNTTSDDADDLDGVAGGRIGMLGNDVSKPEAEIAGLEDDLSEDEIDVVVDAKRRGGRKAKRGRPPSGGHVSRVISQRKEEEEVCFICFDGGDLVVCDRRRCPKVYHPSCVNRDESYFRAKGQWSCGWHICSKCEKSASFMCYTCTYSLCKLCIKEPGFTCIRRNKGFCDSCMRTVLLIETNGYAKEKMDGVNFDDSSCWEYLFKDYWLGLKRKLSLTLEELTQDQTSLKFCGSETAQVEASDDHGTGSGDFTGGSEQSIPLRKKSKKLSKSTYAKDGCGQEAESEGISIAGGVSTQQRMKKNSGGLKGKSSRIEVKYEVGAIGEENVLKKRKKGRPRKTTSEDFSANDGEMQEVLVSEDNSSRKKLKKRSKRISQANTEKEQASVTEDVNWASNELLNFVAHMKNGDKGILSQYDVQELLLEYIKVNKLRDPRKKSQIVCDAMLQALFGKPRVGHFEMLKLLESHFFVKEVSSPLIDENQGEVVDTDFNHIVSEGNYDEVEKLTLDKRRKARKRMEKEQLINFYDYAAIDAHNINLMYLRRSLMEELMNDMNTFHEKVIGSFVRIRVTASNQRQEVYRLVQVVGCGKAPEKYKTGKRTTDIMLEVINLDRKEVITIDIISNQDFTEEECKRLRQSIKLGFIGRLTVGEIQEKARVLQAVRINDYLESEKLRLSHLRDRASEKGRIKEHRECVEKLLLLSTPEEYTRRLNDIPEVHVDPKMDPGYESPEDEGDQDDNKIDTSERPTQSFLKGRELTSPKQVGVYNWSGAQRSSNNVLELERTRHKDCSVSIEEPTIEVGRGPDFSSLGDMTQQKIDVVMPKTEANAEARILDGNKPVREPSVQPDPQLQNLPKVVPPSSPTDSEKIWYYKDPSGKIQGPFTIIQLKKWSKHFPSNLRIWRKSETQEDSILLTDALAGNFQKDLPEWVPEYKNPNQPARVMENYSVGGLKRADNPAGSERKNTGTASSSVQVNSSGGAVAPSNGSPFQQNRREYGGVQAAGTYALQSTGQELHGSRNVTMIREILSGEQASAKDPRRSSFIQQASTEYRNSLPANGASNQQSGSLLNMHTAVQRRDTEQENVQNILNESLSTPVVCRDNTHQSPVLIKDINEATPVGNLGGVLLSSPCSTGINTFKMDGTVHSLQIGLLHEKSSNPDGIVMPSGLSSQGPLAVDQKPAIQNSILLIAGNRKENERTPDSKGQSMQTRIEASVDISTLKGHFLQQQDIAPPLVSEGQNNLVSVRSDKQIDLSTSSTESNTGPEVAPRNPCRMSFQQAKPAVESNIVESISPQRSDASTFPKPGHDVQQSLSFNSSKKTTSTSVLTSAHAVNAYGQTQSGNPQSSEWVPQVHTNMKSSEQSVPTMLSGVNPGAGTSSVNSPNNKLASSDASKPQSSQMNNNPAAAVTFQPPNMSWGNVPNDGQNPGWQVPAQYPQAPFGNMICGPGVQGGFGPANVGWGIMAQGNMNMAWGAQPNMAMAWGPMTAANVSNNSGFMPGNATTNFGWGTSPSGPVNLFAGCGPPAQGNATPNSVWGTPNQGNAGQQGPLWFPPAVGDPNQNAWGVANNIGANNAFGIVQGSMNPTWDASTGNPSGTACQPGQFRNGHPGSRNTDSKSSGPGYGPARPPRNTMHSHNTEGFSVPTEGGICKFHNNGHCKKGAFCNYVHL